MWTNLEGFEQLTSYELDALLEAPVLITALVGAADGELDRQERTWSERLLQSRTYNKPRHLNEYYAVVVNDFLAKVDATLGIMPADIDARNAELTRKLEHINPILARIEPILAYDLYKSFVGLAKETAKASGGFLRIGAISAKEAPWISLPMLTPIPLPPNASSDSSSDSGSDDFNGDGDSDGGGDGD